MLKAKSGKILLLILSVIMCLSLITACGSNGEKMATATSQSQETSNTANETTMKELEPVELTWYTVGTPQKDQAAVDEAVSKITKEKINATIKVNTIDWGAYNDKMKMIIATGEDYDLCFTSHWTNDYASNVAKGAFKPLDSLLEQYGKNILSTVPEKYWASNTIGGKKYSILNYQIYTYQSGVWVKKDLADKYKLDLSNIKKLSDFEPYFEQIKANEPGIIPFEAETLAMVPAEDTNEYYDLITNPLCVKFDDASLKVVNSMEESGNINNFKFFERWYKKGYIKKDAASIKDYMAEQKSGKYAVLCGHNYKPGAEAEMKAQVGYDVVWVPLSKPVATTGSILATMTAVNNNSKNPERAVMFYDLMYSDKQLYNTMCFGIEGKHYNKIGDNMVESIKDAGYDPNTDWEFGCQFNGYYRKGQESDIWEKTMKMNDEALPSPLLGFIFNKEPVKSEVAQVEGKLAEYTPGLYTGLLDVDKTIPEINDKIKKAGLDVIAAEVQKQIDEWRKSNGK